MYEDGYKGRREKPYLTEDSDSVFRSQKRQKELEYELERQKTAQIVARQAMPRMDETRIEQLRINSSKVIGGIFERVIFLETRIAELRDAIEVRKTIHNDMITDIDRDIKDKESMMTLISDANERRNLKLDISILRKEKRHEHVQFWKDVTELTIELREILEQYEVERKIVSIFKDVRA